MKYEKHKKNIRPWVVIAYSKNNHTVKLNYAQLRNIMRMIIFDKDFLREMKKALKFM